MIVPMKKAAILVQSKDASSAVKALGRLGVLHVEHQNAPGGKDINELRDEIELVDRAIGILNKNAPEKKSKKEPKKELTGWKLEAKHIIDLYDRLGRLEEYSRVSANAIKEWEGWGDFDPDRLLALGEKGIYVRLYRVPVKSVKDFPPSVIVEKISVLKGMVHCAVISREMVEIPFKEIIPPKIGINKMRARLAEDNRAIESIKEDIEKRVSSFESFVGIRERLCKELEFQEACSGMGKSGEIAYITGYAPYDKVKELAEAAKREKWALLISDPSPEDMVPTLIRNPRWVSVIAPVFKVLEIIPGYRELDISLWFLVFLSIFFGMLIGDAGYGIVLCLLTLFGRRKWGKKLGDTSLFKLFYIFSFFTIMWGVLTGTFFGQEWLAQTVKPVLPALRDNKNVQSLCFFLGALHLTIAHTWRGMLKLPSRTALADMGWISILWGGFFLARALILGDNFPAFGKWFFIAGPFLVILFTSNNKNIFKDIGTGLGNLLLNFMNTFGDVVSYIRLFAVGLAGIAIADAFNNMAAQIGFNNVVTGFVTAAILIIGHTLNVMLGLLAVLVHGVRLNVLEFCNHADIQWKGFSYKPLEDFHPRG